MIALREENANPPEALMYTFLLIACVLALTFCPLLLDAILTWKEMRRQPQFVPSRKAARLTLATQRSH